MKKENLRIWSSIPKTDRSYTQNANVDGNKQTSVNGLYMVKLATEALGPIGEAWGYAIDSERYDNTKPVMIVNDGKKEILKDGDSIVWEQNHTLLLTLWHGDRSNTIQQYGHTKFRYMKSDGSKMIIDNEAPKKSVTDALKKCLSLLGVCADVYMGLFDDAHYVSAAETENSLKKADDNDAEYEKQLRVFRSDVDDGVKAMDMSPNFEAVSRVYGLKAAMIDRKAPVLGLDSELEKDPLNKMYFKKKEEFEVSE